MMAPIRAKKTKIEHSCICQCSDGSLSSESAVKLAVTTYLNILTKALELSELKAK